MDVTQIVEDSFKKVAKSVKDKRDQVAWWAAKEDGTKSRTTHVCYSPIMRDLDLYETHCQPVEDKNSCHPMRLTAYLNLCQANNLIPSDATFGLDGGKIGMVLPTGHEKHTAYVALCMYRHSDIHGRSLVVPTLNLFQSLKPLGVTFWQCLYYYMHRLSRSGKFTHFQAHSFLQLGRSVYGRPAGQPSAHEWLNLGLAVSLWAGMTPEERGQIKGVEGNYTWGLMNQLACSMEKVPMENVLEILSPESTKLFRNPAQLLKEE